MSDSEGYDDVTQDVEDNDESFNSIIEEEGEGEENEDNTNDEEDDPYIDLRLNNKSRFDNFSKVMGLSNAMFKNDNKTILTTKQLTKYEKTKILGIRAQQLSSGMPALIQVPKNIRDVRQIALLELKARKMPFIIKRQLPNNAYEYIKVEDLEFI